MQTVSVADFKANLSSILLEVQEKGEEIVIAYGRGRKKIAKLVPFHEERGKREFGQFRGAMKIPEDFDEENDAINAMFYGSD